jgi:hypothetical protein
MSMELLNTWRDSINTSQFRYHVIFLKIKSFILFVTLYDVPATHGHAERTCNAPPDQQSLSRLENDGCKFYSLVRIYCYLGKPVLIDVV